MQAPLFAYAHGGRDAARGEISRKSESPGAGGFPFKHLIKWLSQTLASEKYDPIPSNTLLARLTVFLLASRSMASSRKLVQ